MPAALTATPRRRVPLVAGLLVGAGAVVVIALLLLVPVRSSPVSCGLVLGNVPQLGARPTAVEEAAAARCGDLRARRRQQIFLVAVLGIGATITGVVLSRRPGAESATRPSGAHTST